MEPKDWIKQVRIDSYSDGVKCIERVNVESLVEVIKAAIKVERERCAKVAEDYPADSDLAEGDLCGVNIARDIRGTGSAGK